MRSRFGILVVALTAVLLLSGCSSMPKPVYSSDGRRTAEIKEDRGRWYVSQDGVAGREYDGIGRSSLRFSPDGKRCAYAARRGTSWFAVLDDDEGPSYDAIGEGYPRFSPDGSQLAYTAKVGEKWLVVVDGIESRPFDAIGLDDPVFSHDSRHYAFAATIGRYWVVVVDGQMRMVCDALGKGSPQFDRYSDDIGCLIGNGGRWFIAINGRVVSAYHGDERVEAFTSAIETAFRAGPPLDDRATLIVDPPLYVSRPPEVVRGQYSEREIDVPAGPVSLAVRFKGDAPYGLKGKTEDMEVQFSAEPGHFYMLRWTVEEKSLSGLYSPKNISLNPFTGPFKSLGNIRLLVQDLTEGLPPLILE